MSIDHVPTTAPGVGPTDPEGLRRRLVASHGVISRFQDPGGAYPASPTFSAYRGYAWLRDGSFIAEGMSRYGDVASVDAFHRWVAGVLESRAGQVADLTARAAAGQEVPISSLLPTRFRFDGSDGSDPWWDFQTDGYGMWLWQLVTHARRHGSSLAPYRRAVEVAVDYLTAFWDLPCYDWWEEHVEERHPSTLAPVRAGLLAVADGFLDPDRAARARAAAETIEGLVLAEGTTRGRAGDPDAEHLAKWFGSRAVDASLAACVVPFALTTPGSPLAGATLDAIGRDLDVEGGVYRFRADVFYGGGRWPVLAGLLGWNHAVAGDTAKAWRHLEWIDAQFTDDGDLPEQVEGHLLHPGHRAEWIERWGPVATPLLWSHAMFLILADELGALPTDPAPTPGEQP